MYSEDDYIMISALQHYLFCPRQCALIHLDQYWSENLLTASGRVMHERVDTPGTRHNPDCRIEYSVPLCCRRLGINGIADLVEYHKKGNGVFEPSVVEYKFGKPKENRCDEVQLCAQMFCLEEMMNCSIASGVIYYGRTKKRHDVVFDPELRALTEQIVGAVHSLISSGKIPPPAYRKHACESCSLFEYSRPLVSLQVEQYLETIE
mgnify:FL=1